MVAVAHGGDILTETAKPDAGYYSAAQAATLLGVSKRTLWKWEKQKCFRRPQRVQRGELQYRAYSPQDIDQIRMFIHLSRVPNPDVQIIGTDTDGVPIYGQKLRGPSRANRRAMDQKSLQLPNCRIFTSLNEALGAACGAALQMNATRITLHDEQGREFTIEIRAENEKAQEQATMGRNQRTDQQKRNKNKAR